MTEIPDVAIAAAREAWAAESALRAITGEPESTEDAAVAHMTAAIRAALAVIGRSHPAPTIACAANHGPEGCPGYPHPVSAPREDERWTGVMPLDALLAVFRDGDERGWQAEFDFLWSEHQGRMDFLTTSIQETGIREPILLGSDGRVWDGHHRLAAAHRLGLPVVPVEFASRPTPPEDAAAREALGRRVREVWVAWALEQPSPKPSWLVPWDELGEADREVDMRIGETLAREALAARSLPEGAEYTVEERITEAFRAGQRSPLPATEERVLPTDPGFYEGQRGSVWELDANGQWWMRVARSGYPHPTPNQQDRTGSDALTYGAPFTPVSSADLGEEGNRG